MSAANALPQELVLDIDASVAHLLRLRPAGTHNVVAIHPGTEDVRGITRDVSRMPEIHAFIEQHAAEWNLYYSVNEPRPDAPDAKLKKCHIAKIAAVWADNDPQPGDPDAERARLAALAQKLFADPIYSASFVVNSGGGIQSFWLLNSPIEATPDNVRMAEAQGRGIARHLKGDAIQDVNRIMRLPGTINWPNAKKRAQGRTPAPATLIDWDDGARYSLFEMARFAVPIAEAPGSKEDPSSVEIDEAAVLAATSYADLGGELRRKFEGARRRDPDVERLWRGEPAATQKHVTGSDFSFALGGRLRANDLTPTEMGCILAVYEHGHVARLLLEGNSREAFRQIRRAWANQKYTESPSQAFAGEPLPTGSKKTHRFDPVLFTPIDPKAIPPRPWLLGRSALRSAAGILAAAGGGSKSTMLGQRAIAIITGQPITGEKVYETGPAWMLNFEDDKDEINRRIASVCLEFGIPQQDLSGALRLGGAESIRLAKLKDGTPIRALDVDHMIAAIKEYGVIYVALDPLVLCHAVEENNNDHMAFVAQQCATIAQQTGAAIDIAAHTRKGAIAGDPESNRGASATVYGVRIAQTLATMTAEEARAFGVPEDGRKRFVRLDSGKGNYTSPDEHTRWFQRVSVCLDNADGVRDADDVGVLRPYDMASQAAAAVAEQARQKDPEHQSLAQALSDAMTADRCPLASLIGVAMDITGRKERAAQNHMSAAVPLAPAYRLVDHNGARWRLQLEKIDPGHPKSALALCRIAHDETGAPK